MTTTRKPSIGILSDQTLFRRGLKTLLHAHGFHQVSEYASGQQLSEHLTRRPEVLLIDLDHEQEDTMTLVRAMRTALPDAHIVVIGTPLRQGAADASFDDEVETPKGDVAALVAAARSVARAHRPSPEGLRQRRLWEKITPRQRDVMRWLAAGLDNRTIAHKLRIGQRAVKAHVSTLLSAFDCHNRTQLALLALRAGLRPPAARARP